MRKPLFIVAATLAVSVLAGRLSMASEQSPRAARTKTLNVLLIGNSFTGRHNLSQVVKAMAEAGDPNLRFDVTTVIYGGRRLVDHWRLGTQNYVKISTLTPEEERATIKSLEEMLAKDPNDMHAKSALGRHRELLGSLESQRKKWDIVVLQSYRDDLEGDRSLYVEYAPKFAALVKDQGGRVVLYETTPNTQNDKPLSARPDPAPAVEKARVLAALARRIDAAVVPMSMVALRCQTVRPDLTLRFVNDGHLNQTMAYLTACAFYAALFDRSPEGLAVDTVIDTRYLDENHKDKDRDGGPIARTFSARDRADLQRIAWEGVQQFRELGTAVKAALGAGVLDVWAVDPHIKVLRDAKPLKTSGPVAMRAARNEHESGQFAVRCSVPLEQVRVELSPLRHSDGAATIGPDNIACNFAGFIPLKKNTRGSEEIRICAAPCEIPDPLLEDRAMNLPAEAAQPVWLTVYVPKDAVPGAYRGEAAIVTSQGRTNIPIELTVDPFTLPDQRHLLVTNWFHLDNIAKAHKAEMWSEGFWTVLERYARNMAAHRQNVVEVPWTLIQVTQETDGKLSYDYGRFDRFVELFQRAGVGDRIEITHVGRGKSGWGTEVMLARVGVSDRRTGKRVSLGPEEGLAPLLGDLERHLDRRGWLAKAMIHISDEPVIGSLASWRKAAEFVRQAAPRLRRIEAIETLGCSGALEVWVPQLGHFDRWRQAFEARRRDGEFWYYICCNPYGSVYPNRFLDFPLSRVRVLHWINFSEQLAGYLHWGLNFWGAEPFGTPSDRLPPGDTHVLYPGSDGPLSSIRWEIQRESIEDFEYLWLLTAKTAELKKRLGEAADWLDPRRRAEELCRRVVPAIADCEKDPARIVAVRQAVAEEIIALDQPPLLVVQTEPPDGTMVVEGPISIEVRGIADPSTTLKVNGKAVTVSDDGTFACGSGRQLRIEAQRDGNRKTVVRSFPVRK